MGLIERRARERRFREIAKSFLRISSERREVVRGSCRCRSRVIITEEVCAKEKRKKKDVADGLLQCVHPLLFLVNEDEDGTKCAAVHHLGLLFRHWTRTIYVAKSHSNGIYCGTRNTHSKWIGRFGTFSASILFSAMSEIFFYFFLLIK